MPCFMVKSANGRIYLGCTSWIFGNSVRECNFLRNTISGKCGWKFTFTQVLFLFHHNFLTRVVACWCAISSTSIADSWSGRRQSPRLYLDIERKKNKITILLIQMCLFSKVNYLPTKTAIAPSRVRVLITGVLVGV